MSDFSFETAVTVHGTNRLRIQCYLIVAKSASNTVVESLDTSWLRYSLLNDSDDEQTLLLERDVTNLIEFAREAMGVLTSLSIKSSVRVIAMIFDGGYYDSEMLFSEETLDQVYGLWTPSFGPVLTLDRNVMKSPEWGNLLRGQKRRKR